jgi:hypothetical protein
MHDQAHRGRHDVAGITLHGVEQGLLDKGRTRVRDAHDLGHIDDDAVKMRKNVDRFHESRSFFGRNEK